MRFKIYRYLEEDEKLQAMMAESGKIGKHHLHNMSGLYNVVSDDHKYSLIPEIRFRKVESYRLLYILLTFKPNF